MRITRALAVALLFAGCADRTDDEIRASVTLLLNEEGPPHQQAADKLASFGVRAIPTIEAAMHTATPQGRKDLIGVLRKIGDVEAVPLLGHVAVFDTAADVRREAEWTLKQWAQGTGVRADKAKAALRNVDELRAREQAG
jgi:hypothetical protein